MKKAMLAILTAAFLFTAPSFLIAEDKMDDPAIIEMCEEQAAQEGLAGEDKDMFVKECIESSKEEMAPEGEEEAEGC